MDERENLERRIELLERVGAAQAAGEPLDIAQIARERGLPEDAIRDELAHLEGLGLLFVMEAEREPPMLRNAGRQYLARGGEVPRDVLSFLPRDVDDLNARDALLTAGTILVDEFRQFMLRGSGVEYAANLVPRAFAQAITERLALDLFAAAVALTSRLSCERPAGCVAEKILAVPLIEGARVHLESLAARGELSAAEVSSAVAVATSGLFELFQDDDVLNLFAMSEPSDAAVAGHSLLNREVGIVDQRLESWFKPFNWTIATGYLER